MWSVVNEPILLDKHALLFVPAISGRVLAPLFEIGTAQDFQGSEKGQETATAPSRNRPFRNLPLPVMGEVLCDLSN